MPTDSQSEDRATVQVRLLRGVARWAVPGLLAPGAFGGLAGAKVLSLWCDTVADGPVGWAVRDAHGADSITKGGGEV